jgi:3-phosphoshikimate 1-carboxyvinyltransferase
MTMSFPETLEIVPLSKPPDTAVSVPGSKSITNRALVLAALTAKGYGCTLRNALQSEDTEVMVECLRNLGFRVLTDWPELAICVSSAENEPTIPAGQANLFVGNSGTTMRFLTAMVCLGRGKYHLDGVPRMRERPIADLTSALQHLGVSALGQASGCPPVVIFADGLPGGTVSIKGDVSSQFLSGLLLVTPYAESPLIIDVDGPLVSWPYVEMTIKMLRQWGFAVLVSHDPIRFQIVGRQARGQKMQEYCIEPDASAASYFWAAAALAGGRVTVQDLGEKSLQGDVRFVDVLADMGCRVERCSAGVTVHGRPLHGIDVDMNDISDTVMTLAAVACFADGPTTIRNVAHIRHKETDRLAALAAELRKVGADVDEFTDGLTITPRPLHGAVIETYNDHRMAMSMALIGLRVPGVVIKDPGCVAKTYPGFWDDLAKLRG